MPTILQINVDANNGSNGGIARDIGRLVISEDWYSYIAYGRKVIPSESFLIKIGSLLDIILHGINSRLFDNHGLCSTRATKLFLKKIDSIKPDIVHLHNIHGYYINYKILLKYLLENNIPVVWTLHDCWAFTGHCAYFDIVGCNKWKTKCYDCPQSRSYPKSLFLDKSTRNYELKKKTFTSIDNLHIISVSNWLGSLVRESFLSHYSNTIIHNGLDTNIFKFKENSLRESLQLNNKFILLGVAVSWSNSKGLSDYIELSKLLPSSYQIILLGLTKKQIKDLPNTIRGFEKTSNIEELVYYYSMADVIMNLSYQETFGMTTIEGMACGAPAISYNKTASPELVTEKTGFIVEAGNFNQIISAIRSIESRGGREHYSELCREHVLNNFDKDKLFNKYIEIYKNILEK